MAAVLAISKHNFFLLPLIFLINKEKFGKNYFLKLFAIFAPAVILTAIWSNMISGLYVPLNPKADMFSQMDFILQNPIKYLGVIIATILFKTLRLIVTGIGIWDGRTLDWIF